MTNVKKSYSQNGEDLILVDLFIEHYINAPKLLLDIGAGDGEYLSNTKLISTLYGSKRILIDADPYDGVIQMKVTLDKVKEIKKLCGKKNPDLLSIDIDGNDYYILSELLKLMTPTFVVCEYNPRFEHSERAVIAYDENHVWGVDDYYGASAAAYIDMMRKKYALVHYNDCNLIFVHRDFAKTEIEFNGKVFNPHKESGKKFLRVIL